VAAGQVAEPVGAGVGDRVPVPAETATGAGVKDLRVRAKSWFNRRAKRSGREFDRPASICAPITQPGQAEMNIKK
jgi:hypothetical protein